MKILICGKGGCGKSTVVALLAKEIAARKSKVLVIDSDESNIGLHSRLGMQKPEDFMNYFGGKKLLFEKTKELKDKWRLDDLPTDYLAEKGNIQLLSMGKIYQFGEGCACPINALSSKFLEILDLGDEEFLIADTDAGIEHFGRGVEKGADILFVVIDPSRESILLAEKVSELSRQVDKPVYYILNRIADQETEELLLNSMDREKVIAIIPENKEIFISGLAGSEFNMDVKGIREIADMLESEKKARVKIE
ncbi:MAG: ATP-binding protein [Chloroflexi bacterium]|jgi:CO dehydrogenase maturation factor|nr:ATP-binding protein [Chloroflexota bacterium]